MGTDHKKPLPGIFYGLEISETLTAIRIRYNQGFINSNGHSPTFFHSLCKVFRNDSVHAKHPYDVSKCADSNEHVHICGGLFFLYAVDEYEERQILSNYDPHNIS